MSEYLRLLSLSDAELERFDLVEMNLLVAKSIPGLADLDIPRYQRLADEWAEAVRRRLPNAERSFSRRVEVTWSKANNGKTEFKIVEAKGYDRFGDIKDW